MPRQLALNDKGELTWCNSDEEHQGTGSCKHIFHKKDDQSIDEFYEECNKILEKQPTNSAQGNPAILKVYNQDAYHDAMRDLDDFGISCIVQATATGKSSIMTAALDNYSDEPCVFISPKNEINGQMADHNQFTRIGLKGNLSVITYQNICLSYLNNNFDNNFGHLKGKVRLTCLDEIHHMNEFGEGREGKKWKEAIDAFLDYVQIDDEEGSKILGATATPGDGTAIHYFCEDHTVSDMDVADAIKKGILHMPTIYATPGIEQVDYDHKNLTALAEKAYKTGRISKEKYDQITNKINKIYGAISGKAKNIKVSAIHAATKSIVEQDDLEGHGTKILVFCQNSGDAAAKAQEYQQIFAKLYPGKKIKSSKILSQNPTAEENALFKQFQTDKIDDKSNTAAIPKGEIRILAVLDKYSEGVHAPNLKCAIVDRRITESQSLYRQMVGRVMSSTNPTILDFSDNPSKGFINWQQLGEETGNQNNVRIGNAIKYCNAVNAVRYELNEAISPGSYGRTRDGQIVNISEYAKQHYTWRSKTYLNSLKRKVWERGMTIEDAAESEWNIKRIDLDDLPTRNTRKK